MTLQQLTAQDAQFLYIQSPNALTHVTAVSVFDPSTAPGGEVRFKDIIAHIESRLHVSPVFKRKLMRLPMDIDHPYWVEEEHFDLESHITHSRLPEPGDWRQFCIQVARHHSKPMDMSRPLWDMYVIEGLGGIEGYGKGSYAIITRIHHAAIDGVSSAYFFSALSDKDAKGTPAVPLPDDGPVFGENPGSAQVMQRAWLSNVTSPVKFMNTMFRFTPSMISAAREKFAETRQKSKHDSSVPKTRFNDPLTPHRVFDAIEFPLKDISAMRGLVEGSTVNDVILAISGGAVRRYLEKHKELPDQSLTATAPINARSKDDDATVPGNNITAMQVQIGTDIADPVERLEFIKKITSKAKETKGGVAARMMTDLTAHIPGATMAGVARLMTNDRFAPRITNMFISNVPGPQQALYMNGAECTHQFGLAPLSSGMGLFLATPSYNGKVCFNIISDRKIMPDVDFFRECIGWSFDQMKKAKPKPGAKKKVNPKKKAAAKKK